ncbi:MAG TPA: hypothetical protein VK171_17150, partial [Fimbriimonas sp.]|nr:hypothetical protein [Fimbriimonas sp.]
MTTATLFLATAMLQAPKLDADTARLFAWFDSLGSHKHISKPFVGVWRSGGHPQWNLKDSGFLLNEGEKQFTILNLDHAVVSYRKVGRRDFYDDFEIVPLDFKTTLKTTLAILNDEKNLSTTDAKTGRRPYRLIGDEQSIAWWCWRLGYYKESRKLMLPHIKWISELKKDPDTRDVDWYDFVKSIQRRVANEVGEKALGMIEDDVFTRQDLLSKFEELSCQFRNTPLTGEFVEIRDRLRSMMAPGNLVAPGGNSVAQKLDRLLWELQEDRIDSEFFQQIVNLGPAIIPNLIEAISDKRLTRSVSKGSKGPRLWFGSERIFTVGDGALRALEQMVGRRFWNGGENSPQQLARRWYLAKMNRGEEG